MAAMQRWSRSSFTSMEQSLWLTGPMMRLKAAWSIVERRSLFLVMSQLTSQLVWVLGSLVTLSKQDVRESLSIVLKGENFFSPETYFLSMVEQCEYMRSLPNLSRGFTFRHLSCTLPLVEYSCWLILTINLLNQSNVTKQTKLLSIQHLLGTNLVSILRQPIRDPFFFCRSRILLMRAFEGLRMFSAPNRFNWHLPIVDFFVKPSSYRAKLSILSRQPIWNDIDWFQTGFTFPSSSVSLWQVYLPVLATTQQLRLPNSFFLSSYASTRASTSFISSTPIESSKKLR